MARINNLHNFLVDIATAIKAKKETVSETITPADFDTLITSIDTIKGETRTFAPDTVAHTYTPSQGKNAITEATVEAVTSSIDANIQSGNIKSGVTILGVNGSNNVIDTSLSSITPEYDVIKGTFRLNETTGYYEDFGPTTDSTLYITFTLTDITDITLSYKGWFSQGGQHLAYAQLDDEHLGLTWTNDYTDYVIKNVSPGSHTITVGSSAEDKSNYYVAIKMLSIDESPITTNTVLKGNVGFVNGQKVTGTILNNGALTYTPTTSQQTIPVGYTSGGTIAAVTSSIDSNIQSSNIKNGVTILGVSGDTNVINTATTNVPITYSAGEGNNPFVLDQNTGYYEYAGEGYANLIASFTLPESMDITLNYKSFKITASDASNALYLDENALTGLGNVSEYTNHIIPNVSAGSHTIRIEISTSYSTTTCSVKVIPPSEEGITANTVINNAVGFVNGQKVTGTMPNNGALTYIPTTSQQTIPAGYTSGGTIAAVTSAIDSNIIPENIKSGVTILGVNGTLSSGITALEYIESTGTQYIDMQTANLLTDGCVAEMEIAFSNITGNKSVFGAENANPFNRNYLVLYNGGTYFEVGCYNSGGANYTVTVGRKMRIKVSTLKNKPYLYIDDISKYQGSVGTDNRTALTNYLFAFNSNGNTTLKSQFKLYNFKLYNKDNTLVRHFVPVKDGEEVACLYDKVSQTFFYNQGTGNFVAGPEII